MRKTFLWVFYWGYDELVINFYEVKDIQKVLIEVIVIACWLIRKYDLNDFYSNEYLAWMSLIWPLVILPNKYK